MGSLKVVTTKMSLLLLLGAPGPHGTPGPVLSPTTLDPSSCIECSLTGGNLSVVDVPSAGNNFVRSVASFAAGKLYYEVSVVSSSNITIGMCNATFDGSSLHLGGGHDSVGWSGTNVTLNFSRIVDGTPNLTSGIVAGVAIDFDNKLIWVTSDGSTWNLGGTANPATGVGGADFSAIDAGPYFAAYSGSNCQSALEWDPGSAFKRDPR